ncbi:helix-turn-helix domain-containing protein [Streptomyces sp. SID2999]|uniref:helix-turn-helix domain-containing protein n=1 Tax=Streptomyces sp. SID2999 TaxID=2690258 RepID=UPI0031B9E33C
MADLVTAGKILFASRRASHVVTPGRICIRDTKASWDSASAQALAADACTALFSGMLFGRHASAPQDHSDAAVTAARNFIEKNLGSAHLSPAMIAQNVGVPLRTLQRSFSDSDDTIMAFIRRRRLQNAHADLRRLGGTARISEIAARWQFADASHFIRHFKALYGSTPASYLRNLDGRGTPE